ncbi:trans-cinnamate 4-monooxygenase [Phtheirospermum japonicum]|uniref:Trans-cinnamate 4-monooxygenase n=1 Tax=Phtheirospermum japonicum TaxID=374723 RepID=A0A830B1L2_9LAMI|nr:trans-cinnamate 4-monooxygenase [Phtheirospermum japonicum]
MDLLLLLQTLLGLAATAALISKIRGKRLKLPPGPTPLPIFGSWLQIGNNLDHHILAEHADRYGDVSLVRMGQLNVVAVSSPELAKQVLVTQGVEFGSRSRNIVFDIFTGKGQDMIFTEYGEHWRRMRRIVTVPFFTNKVVQQQRGEWEKEAAAVVEDVRGDPAAASEGVVLRRRLQLMVYNNVYKIMFGVRFESEEDGLFVKVKEGNGERSRLGQDLNYNFGDFIPFLRPFLRGYLKVCKEVTRRRLTLYRDSFLHNPTKFGLFHLLKLASTQKCALDHFLEAGERGEINEANILYIVENMNIAAIETTVWALEWAVAELVNNPEVQTKLRAEIDTVLGPGVQVTEPDTHKLPYLQAVIKETLRLRTIVPCLLPHMNLNDAKLGGYDIPAQSRILVNAWRLANDPARWKRPEEFRPERFLEEESKVDTNGNNLKYIPFGVGRRSCPGIVIAMPVLGITLGRLVQNFEMLPPPGQSKVDTTENNGQFAMRILKHSTVVMKPRNV